ncbi:Ankyrin repeat protein 1 [Giardia muris]|uniref:Ankyrin repeat protein 1 n=1 Tax=Giardia muris TaxID=5742 RepID=A0A4Z1SMG9_GIAMU|nr:Ankyrin repeat protein 1 [Giardia muris]|eukprot:TNJ26770.1 Ankyrin repeat protein 1 [Giardia muris]
MQADWPAIIRWGTPHEVRRALPRHARTRLSEGETGLMLAISSRRYEAALILLEHEAGLTRDDGMTALMLLVGQGSALLDTGLGLTCDLTRVLQIDSTCCSTEYFLLLNHLSRVEAGRMDRRGRTALLLALGAGNFTAAVLLLESELALTQKSGWTATMVAAVASTSFESFTLTSTDAGQRDSNGMTALMLSAAMGNRSVAKAVFKEEWGRRDTHGRTALMYACIIGDVALARALATREVGMHDSHGRTALMYAAVHGHVSIIPILLPAEGRLLDNDGWSSLSYAIAARNIDILRVLLREGPRETPGDGRYDSLRLAAALGISEAIELLLEHGPGRWIANGGAGTNSALMAYARWCTQDTPALSQLLEREKGLRDPMGRTALMVAALHDNVTVVQHLRDQEAGLLDTNGHTAIWHALQAGSLGCIPILYGYEEVGALPRGWTPLMLACAAQDETGLEQCIDDEGILRSQLSNGQTALMLAVRVGFLPGVTRLATLEPRLQDSEGRTALMYSVREGHLACALQLKAELTLQDGTGRTALMLAVERLPPGEPLPAFLLVEAGHVNVDGWSALMLAAHLGRVEYVETLRKEIGMQTKGGWTALMLAAQAGNAECVKLLLAETGCQTTRGQTALMLAALRGFVDVVMVLKDREISFRDESGRMAVEYAKMGRHAEVIHLLEKAE